MTTRDYSATYVFYGLVSAAWAGCLFVATVPVALKIAGGVFLTGWILAILSSQGRDSTRALARFGRGITLPYDPVMRRLLRALPRMILPENDEDDPPPPGRVGRTLALIEPRARDRPDVARLMHRPWGWPVLDIAIRIAVTYPILFALGQFAVTGRSTGLGGVELFPADTPRWFAWAAICAIAAIYVLRIMAIATSKGVCEKLSMWLAVLTVAVAVALALAGAFALAVAVALALAGAFALAVAVAGAFALAFALAGAVAVAGAFALAFALAFAIAVAVAILLIVGLATRTGWGVLAYLGLIAIGVTAGILALRTPDLQTDTAIFLVILALLPLINAVFDWLSYGFTLKLLTLGFRRKKAWPAFYGVVDLGVALIMFGLLSLTLIAVLSLIDTLAPAPLFSVADLLTEIEADPAAHLWLIAMVASTLFPTAIHLIIGTLSLITYGPRKLLRRANIASARSAPLGMFSGTLGLTCATFVCAALPVVALTSLCYLLWLNGNVLLTGYLEGLRVVAQTFGWF